MKKKRIRINFSDFDPGFDKTDNYFYHLLRSKYDIIIDEDKPEFHIYSCFGTEYLKYNCTRIFYTGENDIPDFNHCDYALSCHYITFNDRHTRFPNFATYHQHQDLVEGKRPVTKEELTTRKFCSFIASSSWADPARKELFTLLSRYKHIDSPGKIFNNMTMPVTGKRWDIDKLNFMGEHKFSMAFENSSVPGYTTEKILHALVSRSIPIYWGNPIIGNDFNEEAFINCNSYGSFDEVVKRVIEIDNDDELYLKIVNANPFPGGIVPDYLNEQYILDFFEQIFTRAPGERSRRPKYGFLSLHSAYYEKLVSDAMQYKIATSGFKGYARIFKNLLRQRISRKNK